MNDKRHVNMNCEVVDDGGNWREYSLALPDKLFKRLAQVSKKLKARPSEVLIWALTDAIGTALALVILISLPALAESPAVVPSPQMQQTKPVKKQGLLHRAVDKVKHAGQAVASTAKTTAHAVRHPKEAYHAAVKKSQRPVLQ